MNLPVKLFNLDVLPENMINQFSTTPNSTFNLTDPQQYTPDIINNSNMTPPILTHNNIWTPNELFGVFIINFNQLY